MSQSITVAQLRSVREGIELLSQQRFSKARPFLRMEPLTGDRTFVDQIAKGPKPKERGVRHGPTEHVELTHLRRAIYAKPFDLAAYVSPVDLRRILNDPTNAYAMTFSAGFGRLVDEIAWTAALGNSFGGVDGTDLIAFDAANFAILAGGEGLTVDKVLTSKEKLDAAENEMNGMNPYMAAASAHQMKQLLQTTEFGSYDYNSIKAIVDANVEGLSWGGFRWIRSEQLPKVGNDRQCVFWAKNSLALGIQAEYQLKIEQDMNHNYEWQVWTSADYGAARVDETGIVRVDCQE